MVDFSSKSPKVGILKGKFDIKSNNKIIWDDGNVWTKIDKKSTSKFKKESNSSK